MGIIFDEENRTFNLHSKDMSYIMQIVKDGYLAHLYWGKKVTLKDPSHILRFMNRALSPNPIKGDNAFSLDTLPQEYPAYGNTDLRNPAYQVQYKDGSTISDLKYCTHTIFKGKKKLAGLPAVYVEDDSESETLEIELKDSLTGLKVVLSYTVFEKYNAIARSVHFYNGGIENIKLLRALSMSLDFPDDGFDFLHLPGAWARERDVQRRPLFSGIQSVGSRRGASSPQHNPFMALLRKDASEDYGEVYGFSLVYSGNFIAQAEVDQFGTVRVNMGINPFDFTWLLEPCEEFQTPEVVMVYSSRGLGDMSRTYHDLYRSRLCRGKFRDRERPVLINNWEATYFNFNAEKIENIARTGKDLGIELFVLDDGWFGKRDSDNSSLGDWFVDRNKFPEGLEPVAKHIVDSGMQFGLWFEPEMISVDSELYRAHPDWCLHVEGRSRSESRNQLILDLSRKEVCDAVINMVSNILSSIPITYVKWDMNRHMTEIGSAALSSERQRETAHRYMLGLYRIMDEITSAFPDVLFEGCSSGGGRFDPGMLYYMPQIWTSDDTDAIERLKIQYGTSIVYPPCTMGAHVSAVPNHQVSRITPLVTRGNAAMSGNFGYELDISKLSEEDKAIIREQVAFYKDIRHLIQYGQFYRLVSPFEGNEAAWMLVSREQSEAVVFYFKVLAQPNPPFEVLRLKGLDTDAEYIIDGTGDIYGGDELMYRGINIPELKGDFKSFVWRLKRKSRV